MAAIIRPSSVRATSPGARKAVWLAGAVIVFAALAAYRHSFHGPPVFDDAASLTDNLTLRHLWPIWAALHPPPGGTPVSGRPLLNLSFALNYAISGADVGSYHAVNLLIHILAGLTLFGIVRRTLEKVGTGGPPVRDLRTSLGSAADGRAARPYLPIILAFAVALLWTVHPLQTESVTYLSQRAESLMGLFYLLTLYCFIRYADGASSFAQATADKSGDEEAGRSGWAWLSVGACLLGMATKEVMVTAPVMILLYDRTFIAGSFRPAFRRRRWYYFGLAGTWLALARLVAGSGGRGGTAGLGAGMTSGHYAYIQIPAIAHYLRLAVWPHPLIFDYGTEWHRPSAEVFWDGLLIVALLVGGAWALFRPSARQNIGGRALGFASAWFFLILAPSSSVVPVATETMAEHRMYLSLAAVIAVVVVGGYALLKQVLCRVGTGGPPVRSGALGGAEVTDGRAARPYLAIVLVLAVVLGWLTSRRNQDFRSELALWKDAVEKTPDNSAAHNNLGYALLQEGDAPAAIAQCQEALRLNPNNARAHSNLADALVKMGRRSEAIAQYEQALRLSPRDAEAHNNLGIALMAAGRAPEAIVHYQRALQIEPGRPEILNNLGIALVQTGRVPEAIASYNEALRSKRDYAEAYFNLGDAQMAAGRPVDAVAAYEEALRLKPDFAAAHNDFGDALLQLGRLPEAVKEYRAAARLRPDYPLAHNNLAMALTQSGEVKEAAEEFAAASRLAPDDPGIRNNLGCALVQLGRTAEARRQFAEALRLKPGDPETLDNLARLRALPADAH